jgi:TatD DNase family protein
MLHSYGGSQEMIQQFLRIPRIGQRVYYSFSQVINSKSSEKADARMKAVPDDRLLLETDLEDAAAQNDALDRILAAAATAKGWSEAHCAAQCFSNFCSFYEGCLPD